MFYDSQQRYRCGNLKELISDINITNSLLIKDGKDSIITQECIDDLKAYLKTLQSKFVVEDTKNTQSKNIKSKKRKKNNKKNN